jgi:hypothetical protein
LFIVARVFIVTVFFVCYQLVHLVVVTVLHNTISDLANSRGYLCAPVIAIVVAKVYLYVLVVATEDLD